MTPDLTQIEALLAKLADWIEPLQVHAFDDCGEREVPTHLCNLVADDVQALVNAAPALIAAARDRERMREALEPFADCAEQIGTNESDEEWAKFRLLVKDYRNARAALTKDIDDATE